MNEENTMSSIRHKYISKSILGVVRGRDVITVNNA